jgi:hypothetical protein
MSATSDALQQLRDVLDELARSLETGRADAVLAVETPLASAVHAMTMIERRDVTPDDRQRLAESVRAVRQSVARCVRLGRASGDLLRVVFPRAEYGRGGTRQADGASRPTLVSRG